MYAVERSLRGLLWGGGVLLLLGLLKGRDSLNAAAQPTEEMTVEPRVFSQQWVDEYIEGKLGCSAGRGSYSWRGAGFGSNINNLLNAWVYSLAKEGWSDLALIMDHRLLSEVDCSYESGGLVSSGWSCIFSNMPHVCVFDTLEAWQGYLTSSGVSDEDRNKTAGMTLGDIMRADFSTPLDALNIDQFGAKTVMVEVLWRSMTPWLRQEVELVTHTWEIFETSPFIGIHIRRGDKLRETGGRVYTAEEYLSAVLEYLEEVPTRTPADQIKGIWVASDNLTAVDEVRAVANNYFPSVLSENIVYATGGVPGGVQISEVATTSFTEDYESFVYLMADFEQLTAAEVFVGTFSSNLGRLVALLRESVGKPADSSLSLDYKWSPNRKRSLALTGK